MGLAIDERGKAFGSSHEAVLARLFKSISLPPSLLLCVCCVCVCVCVCARARVRTRVHTQNRSSARLIPNTLNNTWVCEEGL